MSKSTTGSAGAPPSAFGVIIPAAGAATRFGSEKLSISIGGVSVIGRSVGAFLERTDVTAVVVAADPKHRAALQEALGTEQRNAPRLHWCDGGDLRAQSVLAGLEWLRSLDRPAPLVAVHDAARPAVSQELIERVFSAAREHGAAVPGIPVVDTIKRIDPDGFVERTLPRSELVAVQTPQAMRLDWLVDAYDRCPIPLSAVTDDVQLLELADRRVPVVDGEGSNLKLTLPSDVARLERILARQ